MSANRPNSPQELTWHEGNIPSVNDVHRWARILVWCTGKNGSGIHIFEVAISEGMDPASKRWDDNNGWPIEEGGRKVAYWAYIADGVSKN